MAKNLRDRGYSSSMDNYKQQQKRKKEEQERNRQAIIRNNKEANEGPVSTQRLTLPKAEAPVSTQRMGTTESRAPSVYGPKTQKQVEFERSPALQKSFGTLDNYLAGKRVTKSGFYSKPEENQRKIAHQAEMLNNMGAALDYASTELSKKEQAIKKLSSPTAADNFGMKSLLKENQKAQAAQDYVTQRNGTQKLFNDYTRMSNAFNRDAASYQRELDTWKSTIRPQNEIQADIASTQKELESLQKQQSDLNESMANTTSTLVSGVMPWTLEKAMNDSDEADRIGKQIDNLRADLALLNEEMEYSTYYKWRNYLDQDIPVSAQRAADKGKAYNRTDVKLSEAEQWNRMATEMFSPAGALVLKSEFDPLNLQQMSDEERAIYKKLYEQQGQTAAENYLRELQSISLNTRRRISEENAVKEWVKDQPLGGQILWGLGTTLASPAKLGTYISQGIDYLSDGKMQKDASYNRLSYLTSAYRGQVGEDIDEWLGDKGEKWGVKWGSFGYQTLTSMADFMFNMLITGGFGVDKEGIALYEQGERTARALNAWKGYKAAENLSLALMGTQAAADAVMEAKDRGLDDGQAFWLGTAAGAIEVLTEKVSIENLMEGLGNKSKFLYLVKNILAEGSEEASSDMLNLAMDTWISKDQSEWHQAILKYKRDHPGATDKEALNAVWLEQAKQTGLSALGGAMSGGLMAGGTLALDFGTNYAQNRSLLTSPDYINAVVARGMNTEEGSAAYKAAEQLQAKGENVRMRDVVRASRDIDAGIRTSQNYVQEQISEAEKYENTTASKKAAQIQKKLANNEQVTVKEVNSLEDAIAEARIVSADRLSPIITMGLESEQNSEAYQAAEILKKKIDAGQKISVREVAKAETAINEAVAADYKSGKAETIGKDMRSKSPSIIGKRLAAETGHETLKRTAEFLAKQNNGSQQAMAEQLNAQIESGNIDAELAGKAFQTVREIQAKARKNAAFTRNLQPREVTADMDDYDASAARVGVSEQEAAWVKAVAKLFGTNTEYRWEANEGERYVVNSKGERVNKAEGEKLNADEKWVVNIENGREENGIVYLNALSADPVMQVLSHEVTHTLENTEAYKDLKDMILRIMKQDGTLAEETKRIERAYRGKSYNLNHELVSFFVQNRLLTDEKTIRETVKQNRSFGEWVRSTLDKVLAKLGNQDAQNRQQIRQARDLWAKALEEVRKNEKTASKETGKLTLPKAGAQLSITNIVGTSGDYETEDLSLPVAAQTASNDLRKEGFNVRNGAVAYNLTTLQDSDVWNDKQKVAKQISKAIGISQKKAKRYIESVQNIGRIIADNRERLDYDSAEGLSAYVSNAEYGGSFDYTTLCTKRRFMTGTISAIQKKFAAKGLTSEEFLTIRKMLEDKGYQVSCPMCYVEGSRTKLGEYAEDFIKDHAGVTVSQLTDPVELENLRTKQPEIYSEWEKYLSKFNQRKPKMYQARTAYNGEIIKNFKDAEDVRQKNLNGGIRFQSFSDFEAVHLLDNMQAITDMARVGLAGQAYTKMIDYVMAMGGTGLKINMSLVAKGVDANGNLVLDETGGMTWDEVNRARTAYSQPVDGMDEDTRTELQRSFSQNVGTIVVVFDDAQLRAAMADDRIDFIIPYHRSQWAKSQHYKMGMPLGSQDYTIQQNERTIKDNGKPGKRTDKNLLPNEYWNPRKDGKWNAENYLRLCAEQHIVPKFASILQDNGDGSYSLQPNGSTDGYWKLLSDYKMYDNDGKFAPQNAVQPLFDTAVLEDILNREDGSHKTYPVADDVVQEFMALKETKGGGEVTLDDYVGKDQAAALRAEYAQAQKAVPSSKQRGPLWLQEQAEHAARFQHEGAQMSATERDLIDMEPSELDVTMDSREAWDEIIRDIRMYAGDTKAGRTLFEMAQTHGISAVENYIRTQGMEGATDRAIRKYFASADEMIEDAISPKAARAQGIENALDDFFDEAKKPGADRITTRVDAPFNGTLKDRIIASALYLYRKMVDSGEAVSRLGKYSGDPHLYHYYNMARASTNAAVSMIQNAQTDAMGRKVGDSLNQIFDRIRAKGDDYYADLQLYLYHMLNIERMSRENPMAVAEAREEMAQFRRDNPEFNGMTDDEIMKLAYDPISMYHDQAQLYADIRKKYDKALAMRNKPVFGMETRDEFGNKKTVEIDARTSQKVAEELREELSKVDGFEEDVEAIYKYIDNLTKYRIDSGLITEDDYKTLRKAYPHYVPAAAMMQVEEAPAGSKEKSTEVGKTIKRAKGNTRYVLQPLHKVLAQQTLSTVREGSKNRFGQMLLDRKGQSRGMIKNVEKIEGDFNEDTFDQETKNRDNTFVVRQDGKRYEIKMDNALYEAIDALSPTPEDDNIFMKAMHKATDLFKALNTSLNPVFMIKNPIRDVQDAGLYSKDLSEFVKQYPQAAKEIAKNGKYWQLYQSLGGLYSSMFDFMTGEKKQSNKLKAMTLDKFEALQMGIEQAPRLAEFMATVKRAEARGEVTMDDLMEAIYNAAEVTVNFGRSGKWGKALNRSVVPFFNPGIQGMDKIARTVANTEGFDSWAKLAGKCALLGVVPAILNRLLWGKRKDYEEMTQNNRDGYYLFPLRYGVWLRLPKGRALSVFGMATDRIIQMADGKDADWASFFRTAWNQIAPEATAYWQPFIDARLLDADNPGKTWYGGDIENRRMQSLAPGERYDTSTDAISKWIGKTFGLSPKKVNYLLDQYSGVLGDIFLPLMSQKVHKDIFTSAFTVDTDFSNRLSNDFYNLLDKSEYAKNSTNSTPEDASAYKYLYGKSLDINKVNKAIREIEEDSSLSNKEKEELTRAQYMLRNEIMRDAIAQMKAYEKGGTDNDIYKSAEEARIQKERESKTYNFKGQEMSWDDLSGRQKKIAKAQEAVDKDKNADLTSILGEKAPSQGQMYSDARDAGISNQKYLDALTAVDNANNGDSNYTNDETTAGLNQAIADGKISQSEANKLWPIISGGSPKNNPYSSGKLEPPSVETEASQASSQASSYENQTYTFKGEEKPYSELTSRQQKIVRAQDTIKADPEADLSDILIGEDKKATKLVAGYQEARAKGISNETYLLALTAIDDTDNGDGNYSQKKEVNPALQELVDEGTITKEEASTLWKIITGGADKNNPFPVGAIGPIGLRLPKIG